MSLLLVPVLSTLADSSPDLPGLLAEFEKLGFPDLSTARYVRFDPGPVLERTYRGGETSGNGWLLAVETPSTGRTGRLRFSTLTGCQLAVLPHDPNRPEQDIFNPDEDRPFPLQLREPWEEADPDRDARRTLWSFEALRAGKGERFSESDPLRVKLFFMALALRQRGQTGQADRIYTSISAVRGETGKSLAALARNELADQLYRSAFFRYAETGDLWNWQLELRSLLDRFPKDWESRPGVERIHRQLQAEAASPAAVPEVLSEAGKQIAGDLLKATSLRRRNPYGQSGTLWLVPSSWTDRQDPAASPDLRIRALGPMAIPFLVMLADDSAFTRIPRLRGFFDYSSDWRREDPYGLKGMPRPMTRGEAARAILKDIVPEWISEKHDKPDEFLAACKGFYLKIKELDEDAVAACFLREGRYGASPEAALAWFRNRAAKSPVPVYEKYLLEGPETDGEEDRFSYEPAILKRVEEMVRYGALRPAEATALATNMAARLEAEAAAYQKPDNISYGGEAENRKHVEEMRKRLREKAAGLRAFRWEVGTDTLLEGWPGEGGWSNILLQARLEALAPKESFGTLIAFAARCENPERRFKLAWYAANLLEKRERTELPGPTDHADAWKILLADARAVDGDHPVCDAWLALQEFMFGRRLPAKESSRRWYRGFQYAEDGDPCRLGRELAQTPVTAFLHLHGEEGRILLLERARKRLAGTAEAALPPIPSAAEVDEAGRRRLAADAAAAKSRPEAEAFAARLPIAQREALPASLSAAPEANRALAPLAWTVTNVTVEGGGPLEERLRGWIGKPASPELARLLREHVEDGARAGKGLSALLERKPNFGGCVVVVTALEPGSPRGSEKGTVKVVGYTGLVAAQGVYERVDWRTTPGKSVEFWYAFDGSPRSEAEAFEKTVDGDFFGGSSPAPAGALLVFQTQWRRE